MPHVIRLGIALVALLAAACAGGTDRAHCMLPDIDPDVFVTEVEVTTTTGSEATDSDIYLVLELEDGTQQGLYLDDPSTDNFEAFATETFVVPISTTVGEIEHIDIQKDTSFLEGGDWDLDGLTVTFLDDSGTRYVAYDNTDGVEHMTGDERTDLACL